MLINTMASILWNINNETPAALIKPMGDGERKRAESFRGTIAEMVDTYSALSRIDGGSFLVYPDVNSAGYLGPRTGFRFTPDGVSLVVMA